MYDNLKTDEKQQIRPRKRSLVSPSVSLDIITGHRTKTAAFAIRSGNEVVPEHQEPAVDCSREYSVFTVSAMVSFPELSHHPRRKRIGFSKTTLSSFLAGMRHSQLSPRGLLCFGLRLAALLTFSS